MEQDHHSAALQQLCRVCGRCTHPAKKKRSVYPCKNYQTELKDTFDISIISDNPLVHPAYFCQTCKTALYNVKDGKSSTLATKVCSWEPHQPNQCSTCLRAKEAQRGGRPAKRKGRPATISTRSAIAHVQSIAPPSFVPPEHVNVPVVVSTPFEYGVTLEDLSCNMCRKVLNQPLTLTTCNSLVCASCLLEWLSKCPESLPCPCCSETLTDFTTIEVAPLIQKLLGGLLVTCMCGKNVAKQDYIVHRKSGCGTNVPQAVTVESILVQPACTPLSPLEMELQTSLTKRSLATSPDGNLLRVKTGGQV